LFLIYSFGSGGSAEEPTLGRWNLSPKSRCCLFADEVNWGHYCWGRWRRLLVVFCGRAQSCFGEEGVSWRNIKVYFCCVRTQECCALTACMKGLVC